MTKNDLLALGLPGDPKTVALAFELVKAMRSTPEPRPVHEVRDLLESVAADPEAWAMPQKAGGYYDHAQRLATRLCGLPKPTPFIERDEPAPHQAWGGPFEDEATQQMENACRLPVAVRGALMPDAHSGYGLPIGGVLACENAVIPYAVGVDIACRMQLTIFDYDWGERAAAGKWLPHIRLEPGGVSLDDVLEQSTAFGMGAAFENPPEHEVLEEPLWREIPALAEVHDLARRQIGSSGAGNHFVEFGVLTWEEAPLRRRYPLALLSHSGSRGAGYKTANHYSKLAAELHPDLPRELKHLAWLELGTEPGDEYWAAMNLFARYAQASHDIIHANVTERLGLGVVECIQNHHNLAWKETHDGREVIVHRKGATPANKGQFGIIPGTMCDPAFVVVGKGNEAALRSAAHGAGRAMSRAQARRDFTREQMERVLAERGVTLLSAPDDQTPFGYKPIERVIAQQDELVKVVARFDPKIVKMAP